MTRNPRPVATTATRSNRILIILAAAWMAAAIALGGAFGGQPADVSASGSGAAAAGDATP